MSLTERKRVALCQKLDGLNAEFEGWLKVSAKPDFEKHKTQLHALTQHLSGLLAETHAMLDTAIAQGTVLTDGRNIESIVLGLRRIWEFFRSKYAQRLDADMRRFLRAADELSWACYEPVLNLSGTVHREPPLVFLNGGLSPFQLSRNGAFYAEEVPGEKLVGRAYDALLRKLPIPLIGVPWYQVTHLPDLPVVAHETGHAVEQDFGLGPRIVENLKAKLGAGSDHLAHWTQWSHEVFADMWGCLLLGPAYVSSLVDFISSDPRRIQGELSSATDDYPTAYLRLLLCVEALRAMKGFDAEAADIETMWRAQYPKHEMTAFGDDVPKVVAALLTEPLNTSGFNQGLVDFTTLRFTPDMWKSALAGARQAGKGWDPTEETTTMVTWTAAARRLYDQDPEGYATHQRGKTFIEHAEKLIAPGERAAHAGVRDSSNDLALGRALFTDLVAWVSP